MAQGKKIISSRDTRVGKRGSEMRGGMYRRGGGERGGRPGEGG
jgi:hypothetical protein